MEDHKSRLPVARRDRSAPDWLFWAFVALAGSALAFKVGARNRVQSAFDQAAICLARRDAACVADAIERGRRFAADDDARLDLATAGLDVLTGKADDAATVVLKVRSRTDLPTKTSADLLLVEGDLWEARGEPRRARESWTSARPLVDADALVRPRLDRADAAARERAGALAGELVALKTSFDELFDLALTETTERVSMRAADLAERLGHLPESEGRAKLVHAVDVARRAAAAAERKRATVAYDPYQNIAPPEPPPPLAADAPHYDPRVRERDLTDYETKLADYTRRKKASDDRRARGEADAISAARSLLEEGTRLVDEGFAGLRALTVGAAAGESGRAGGAPP